MNDDQVDRVARAIWGTLVSVAPWDNHLQSHKEYREAARAAIAEYEAEPWEAAVDKPPPPCAEALGALDVQAARIKELEGSLERANMHCQCLGQELETARNDALRTAVNMCRRYPMHHAYRIADCLEALIETGSQSDA